MGKEEAYWEWTIFPNSSLPLALLLWQFPTILLCIEVTLSFSVLFVFWNFSFPKPFPLQWTVLRMKFLFQDYSSWKPFKQTFSAHHSFQGVEPPYTSLSWCGPIQIWQRRYADFGLVYWATNLLTARQKGTTRPCFTHAVSHIMLT